MYHLNNTHLLGNNSVSKEIINFESENVDTSD